MVSRRRRNINSWQWNYLPSDTRHIQSSHAFETVRAGLVIVECFIMFMYYCLRFYVYMFVDVIQRGVLTLGGDLEIPRTAIINIFIRFFITSYYILLRIGSGVERKDSFL